MMPKRLTRSLLLAGSLSFMGALQAGEPAAEGATPLATPGADTVMDREETVVIGGVPTVGKPILPATETEYRFKLTATGDVLTLRWADLEENERRRVMKIYGMETRGDRRVFGDKIAGVRFVLDTGKSIEGLAVPERDRPGYKAIRTAKTPLMHIPEREIKATETFEAFESDFFSALEVYQRWILERPPGANDAAAHYQMAERCAQIGVYAKAIEHLESAIIIDPRMAERTTEFRKQLVEEDANQQVKDLFTRMLTLRNAGDYFSALEVLEKLDRNFPNHYEKSRWDSLRQEIEQGTKTDVKKRVIFLAYTLAMDLVQERYYKKTRVDEKGNKVASIPGKQVATRAGHLFRGKLVSGGQAGEDMVMLVGETSLTIAGKEIVQVKDVDLAVAVREIEPTFEELKEYVTDINAQTGLKAELMARISKMIRKPVKDVQMNFDTRLSRTAVYDGTGYKADPVYTNVHELSYGIGTWLRDGERPGPIPTVNRTNSSGARYANGRAQTIYNQVQPPDPDQDPNLTNDPAVWWQFQREDVRLMVLRAMAAEKLFDVKERVKIVCTTCNGNKNVNMLAPGGNYEPARCANCRGIGYMVKILYR